MGIIEIDSMEFYAFHGCYKEEQVVGTRFRVHLTLEVDLDPASHSDNVNDTVSYLEAYELVREQMMIPSHVIEHVAGRILDALFSRFDKVLHATVKVSKLNPPLGGEVKKVSVILSR